MSTKTMTKMIAEYFKTQPVLKAWQTSLTLSVIIYQFTNLPFGKFIFTTGKADEMGTETLPYILYIIINYNI